MTMPRNPSRNSVVSPEPNSRYLQERQCRALEDQAQAQQELVKATREQTQAILKLEETVRQALHKGNGPRGFV